MAFILIISIVASIHVSDIFYLTYLNIYFEILYTPNQTNLSIIKPAMGLVSWLGH